MFPLYYNIPGTLHGVPCGSTNRFLAISLNSYSFIVTENIPLYTMETEPCKDVEKKVTVIPEEAEPASKPVPTEPSAPEAPSHPLTKGPSSIEVLSTVASDPSFSTSSTPDFPLDCTYTVEGSQLGESSLTIPKEGSTITIGSSTVEFTFDEPKTITEIILTGVQGSKFVVVPIVNPKDETEGKILQLEDGTTEIRPEINEDFKKLFKAVIKHVNDAPIEQNDATSITVKVCEKGKLCMLETYMNHKQLAVEQ